MSDWNLWTDKAKSLTVSGMEKAKGLGDMAKLNMGIMMEEEKCKQLYLEIGKLYAETHRENPESPYEELFMRLDKSLTVIRENKEMLAKLRKEEQAEDIDWEADSVDWDAAPTDFSEAKQDEDGNPPI